MGTAKLFWKGRKILLSNCLYVPSIVVNLVSPGKLMNKGCKLVANKNSFSLISNQTTMAKGTIIDNIFVLENPQKIRKDYCIVSRQEEKTPSLKEFHLIYVHAFLGRLKQVKGVKINSTEAEHFV